MPRIFMSVLAGGGGRPVGRECAPSPRLALLRTPRGPRKWRQHDEVHAGEQGAADEPGDSGRDPDIAVPEPPAARAPDVTLLKLRCEAAELLVAVVHVKDFVAQHFLEDRARRRVVVDTILVDGKASSGGFFCDVEECEQPRIALVFDDEIVE